METEKKKVFGFQFQFNPFNEKHLCKQCRWKLAGSLCAWSKLIVIDIVILVSDTVDPRYLNFGYLE